MPRITSGESGTVGAVTQQQNVSGSRASVWGRHLSIMVQAAGAQVCRPIGGGPSTAGPGPGSEAPSGVKTSCEWATETKWWHAGGKLVDCAAGYNKGIWIHAVHRTNSVADSSSQMVLIKDVPGHFPLIQWKKLCVCVCVCDSQLVWWVELCYWH